MATSASTGLTAGAVVATSFDPILNRPGGACDQYGPADRGESFHADMREAANLSMGVNGSSHATAARALTHPTPNGHFKSHANTGRGTKAREKKDAGCGILEAGEDQIFCK